MLIINEDNVETPGEKIDDVDEELGAQDNENNDDNPVLDEDQDENNNMLIEKAAEDACYDLDMDEIEYVVVEDVHEAPLEDNANNNTTYKSRSGRIVKRQDYRSINKKIFN